MPQERKKRGRRQEKKEKQQEFRSEEQEPEQLPTERVPEDLQGQFFGLLDEQELAYFDNLDTLITANQFDEDEKNAFIENTFAEIQGRELKIATSPASKFLEKFIFLLRRDQIIPIAESFLPHFLDLIHRPSASFCCEALILRLGHDTLQVDDQEFRMLNAFGSQIYQGIVEIMSHTFASHVARMYLLVLTGSSASSFRKRDTSTQEIAVQMLKELTPSATFHEAVDTMVTNLVNNVDFSTLQSLAISPTANPVLQIIVQYELNRKETTPIISLLLPEENMSFARTLLFDPIGSHLMEIVITKCPGRTFKRLHKDTLNGNLASIARHKTGAYVLVKAIERFSSGNIQKALEELTPVLSDLVNESTAVVTALIEQCRRREVGFGKIQDALGPINLDADVPVHVSILFQTMLSSSDGLRDLIARKLVELPQEQIIAMSKQSAASRIIQAALDPAQPAHFRKQIISKFLGKVSDLAIDNIASHVVDALWTGSTGLKFLRDQLINEILVNELALRQTIPGRAVCRNWRKWSRESAEETGPKGIDRARKRHASASNHGGKKPRAYK